MKLLSVIDDRSDDDEVPPVIEPRADSSCCIMLSRPLDRSDRVDTIDAELVDCDEAPAPPAPPGPLAPSMPPPGGGGGGPSADWACSRPDMVPDDSPFRK